MHFFHNVSLAFYLLPLAIRLSTCLTVYQWQVSTPSVLYFYIIYMTPRDIEFCIITMGYTIADIAFLCLLSLSLGVESHPHNLASHCREEEETGEGTVCSAIWLSGCVEPVVSKWKGNSVHWEGRAQTDLTRGRTVHKASQTSLCY